MGAPMAVIRTMLSLRLTPEEFGRLERLTEHYGLNEQSLIKALLKAEDDIVAHGGSTIFSTRRKAQGHR
jgi:hypothetical protein